MGNNEVSNQPVVPDQEQQPATSSLAMLENEEPLKRENLHKFGKVRLCSI